MLARRHPVDGLTPLAFTFLETFYDFLLPSASSPLIVCSTVKAFRVARSQSFGTVNRVEYCPHTLAYTLRAVAGVAVGLRGKLQSVFRILFDNNAIASCGLFIGADPHATHARRSLAFFVFAQVLRPPNFLKSLCLPAPNSSNRTQMPCAETAASTSPSAPRSLSWNAIAPRA